MLTLLAALDHHAQATPHKPAFVIGKRGEWQQFSFADLAEETDRWARAWAATGAAPRSVVFLILQHGAAMYPAFLGAMRAGFIPSFMPFPTPKQDPEIYWRSHRELFARVKPAAVLTYAELVADIRAIADAESCVVLDCDQVEFPAGTPLPVLPDREDPAAVALLQHSSGTTGLKKGVALTWRQIAEQAESVSVALALGPQDRVVSWLPIYHDMGLIATFLLPVMAGIMVVSIDAFEWLTRPDMFLDEIARFRGTLCWLPNFAFNHLVRTRDRDRSYDLSSLRAVIDCSEPCKPETAESFIRCFAPHGLRPEAFQVSYGMAEVVFAATQTPLGARPRTITVDRAALTDRNEIVPIEDGAPEGAHFLSCGRPIRGVQLRIAAPPQPSGVARLLGLGGRRQSAPQVGEIELNCPFLFEGYFRNPAATAASLNHRWFKSGDIGFIHDGELYVCGRVKEMLIVHGRNFYANDIEALINPLAGIKPGRVVAVGVFDPVTGSEEAVVLAETTLDEPEARAELAQAIRQRVFDALNLTLRRVEIASEGTMVKTTSGKISRDENIRRLSKELVSS